MSLINQCPIDTAPCKTCNDDKAEAVKWYMDVQKLGLNKASKEAASYFNASVKTWNQFKQAYIYRYGESGSIKPVKKKTNNTFNLVNENIDWAKWSWNPVTGCLHGCKYCYARDIANRFYKNKFTPTFHEHRLKAPYNTTIPKELSNHPGRNKVFVCSMADLFGDWVAKDWIEKILSVCADTPKWTYIFLTKNPKRLSELKWPVNAWIGTTVTSQGMVAAAEKAFEAIQASVKFLSCEPLMDNLTFNNISVFDWVIVGARSKSTQAAAMMPDYKWILSLLGQAWDAGCKVYCKPNLSIIKEYPKSPIKNPVNPI